MEYILFLFLFTHTSYAQEGGILSGFIEHNVVGEITATLNDPQAQRDTINRMQGLRDLYQNRANSCEEDLNSLNHDLISPQLQDDILDNNTFLMVNDIHRHLNITLRRRTVWWDSRPNYNDYSCQDMLEREGLTNLPRTMGLQFHTGQLRSQICSNYDRMIQCFVRAEDIMMDEEILIFQGPRYYQMEYFDNDFVREHFPSAANQ